MAAREATLARLIEEEWPKLRRYFRTLVPESDVLDLVQSTMLAYVESEGPSDPAKERAYLWGVAWRQSQRYYEKHRRKGVPFEEYDITMGGPRRGEMIERSNGGLTVPQIFIDGRHVGDSDRLAALDADGKLNALLGI